MHANEMIRDFILGKKKKMATYGSANLKVTLALQSCLVPIYII